MVHLAQIEYLLIIAVIPLLFLFYGVMQYRKRLALKRFGDPALIAQLTPRRSTRRGWVKILFYSLALFFFAIGLARPQIGARVREVERVGAEIMIALDVSNSMLAQDYTPNRLERAKLAISRLVDKLQQDRIGLIVFAGDAFVQLPITTDYVSAKIFLNTISTESVPKQGTALGEAIMTGLRSFSATAENSRALILITDGENHEDDAVEAARMAKESGVRLFCIGIGSEQGKPIPMPDGNLLKDEEGNIVVTRLDEASLIEIARIGNGAYVRAGNGDFGLDAIIDGMRELDKQNFSSEVFEDFDEQYMYFFGIALFFLLLEFLVNDRKGRRIKSLDVLAGKGGKEVLVVIWIVLSTGILAAQPDRAEVRRGNRAFARGEFATAELEYRRALEKDSTSIPAHYNLNNARYKQKQYEQAEAGLKTKIDSILHPSQRADAFHNLGNMQLLQKKYAESIESYKDALRLRPNDMETKSNLAYAQKMLENQNQDDQKDQDNQDDNQDNQNDNQNNPDQNQNQNQNQKEQETPPKITPQAAKQMLEAMQQKEKETQEKVNKEKVQAVQPVRSGKNW